MLFYFCSACLPAVSCLFIYAIVNFYQYIFQHTCYTHYIAYYVACSGDRLYLPGLNELLYRHVMEVWVSPIEWQKFHADKDFDQTLLSRLSRWMSAREPERTVGLLALSMSWFKQNQPSDNIYKNYVNTFAYEHIKDHPLVKVLMDKEDFMCKTSESKLYERLKKCCSLTYKEYSEEVLNGDPIVLLFGNMIRGLNKKYIDLENLTIPQNLLREYINTKDEL